MPSCAICNPSLALRVMASSSVSHPASAARLRRTVSSCGAALYRVGRPFQGRRPGVIIPAMSKKDEPFAVTRRDFLKSAGVGGLATAVTSGAADVEAQTGPRVIGPGEAPVTLNVNGKRVELRIEPRVTLLDALRNRADLTGNKRVCDRGSCGACTMIVDGRTVYSCSTLAIDVQGKQVRTVDGLASANGTLHPVQQAFVDVDAMMCGFCTPG